MLTCPLWFSKETIYLDGYEVYHEFVTGTVDFERQTLHVNDDESRVAMVETKTIENGTPVTTPVPRIRYQHSDHLGSCSVETTDTGALISFEEYYPYGGTSFQSTSSSSQVSAKRYRYNGKEKDEETNLYYYGARYYISWLGRWMNCDPLYDRYCSLNAEDRAEFDLKEISNLYRYCSNNPVNFVDLKGTNTEDPQKKQTSVKKESTEEQKKEPVSNLIVEGDDPYKKDVIEALKKLDPTAEINMKTGEITVGKKATKGHEKGHELLERIINNEKGHKVTIKSSFVNAAKPLNEVEATKENVGSSSDVYWSVEPTLPTPTEKGVLPPPTFISLGHELIHAEHAIRGVWSGKNEVVSYAGLDKRRDRAPKEELKTVGLGGYNKKGDITENDLRREARKPKLPLRVRYNF